MIEGRRGVAASAFGVIKRRLVVSRDPRGRAGGPTLLELLLLVIVLLAIWSLVQGRPVWEMIGR